MLVYANVASEGQGAVMLVYANVAVEGRPMPVGFFGISPRSLWCGTQYDGQSNALTPEPSHGDKPPVIYGNVDVLRQCECGCRKYGSHSRIWHLSHPSWDWPY